MNRRQAMGTLGGAALLSGGFFPLRVRAADKPRSPNGYLQIAQIGLGGIAGWHVSVAGQEEALIAICDAYPEKIEARVEKMQKIENLRVPLSEVKRFVDYREMLDQLGDQIDAVQIATPDHNHAALAMECMRAGKHVLVEKPMSFTIEEAFRMQAMARKMGLMTQMGNQGHMTAQIAMTVNHLIAGNIGPVKEIYHWCGRTFGGSADGIRRHMLTEWDPAYRRWSLPVAESEAGWLLQEDDYTGADPLGKPGWGWRADRRWGAGNLGDWGCHTMDPAYWARVMIPDVKRFTVQCLRQHYGCEFYFHKTNQLKWEIPGDDKNPPCNIYWYDGRVPDPTGSNPNGIQNMPERVLEIYGKYDKKVPEFGAMFVGEAGVLLSGGHAEFGGFLPRELQGSLRGKESDLIPDPVGDKFTGWYSAIRTGKPAAADFEYSAGLTEFVLSGILAESVGPGAVLEYDREQHCVLNHPRAQELVSRKYRDTFQGLM